MFSIEELQPLINESETFSTHPSKFSEVVAKSTSLKPELPEKLKNILIKKENYEKKIWRLVESTIVVRKVGFQSLYARHDGHNLKFRTK